MRLRTVLGGFVAVILAFASVVWINSHGRSEVQIDPAPEDDPSRNTIYGANPFADERPDPPPHGDVDESSYDFDRMALGSSGTHTFVVRNTGEGPLKLAQGPSTCKCTVGKLGQDQVAPGETADIEVTWEPKSLDPAFSQYATIFTSDPENPEFRFTVHGAVVPWAATFPNSTWRSSSVSEVEPTPFEFVVVSQLAESFTITGIETSSDLVEIGTDDITPIPEEELELYELARCGYRIRGRLALGFPVGEINEHVTLSTDIEQMPQIQLVIESRRIGPYQLVGPGWQGSLKLLQMGRFDAEQGKSVKLSFFAESNGDDFEITDVRVEPPVLNVSCEVDSDFESETRRRIWITVATVPDMTPARFVLEDPVHVVLLTNDPEVPEWGFAVTLQAN